MPTSLPLLSKSSLKSFDQCPLRLWYEHFHPELATPPGDDVLFRMQRGTEVGELARWRYPDGTLVTAEDSERELALCQTLEAMKDASAPVLYEAAFQHETVLARADILVRSTHRPTLRRPESWDLVEVKSAMNAKDVYVRDLAIQLWVARSAGVRVRRAGLLLLNRDYVYDGSTLDVDELFRFEDLTAEAEAMHGEVEALVGEAQEMFLEGEVPQIDPGEQCREPYECPFLEHCTKGARALEHPVSDLPYLNRRKRESLKRLGVEQIPRIPRTFPLTDMQERVRHCVVRERPFVSTELAERLENVVHPVHHLDFEAFSPAIPRYAGTSPYEAVPFQYSVHTEIENGKLLHREFLHTDGEAPHRTLAANLVADLGAKGSICVYTGYERRILKALAAHAPELSHALHALTERLWDLYPVVRDNYYHPDFRGSFSLKAVTPVLAPQLCYERLAIGDGTAAATAYEQSLEMPDGPQRESVLESLREYCGVDTLALVEARRSLAVCAQETEQRSA